MSKPAEPTPAEFQAQFEALLDGVADQLRDHAFFRLPSDAPPWFDSGIDLDAGERITAFVAGKTRLKGTDLWFGADFQVWFRIGPAGEAFRGTRASHSFSPERPGRLYLATYFPGEWASRDGKLAVPPEAYGQAEGELAVLVLRWRGEPLEGLRRLAEAGDVAGLVAAEIDRLSHPVPTPDGWRYLWFVGPAEIYRTCHGHHDQGRDGAICCHTRHDVGLLQKEVSLPLLPETRLRWSWLMERLPSSVREDELSSHDYLSIAVEFDNGQDITYYWSAELPVGTAYRCPIPTWHGRETHVVVRSGQDGLGEWRDEARDVYSDYAAFIGGPRPTNIVRVWLIAVSLFQRGEGKCRYADIAFETAGRVVEVR